MRPLSPDEVECMRLQLAQARLIRTADKIHRIAMPILAGTIITLLGTVATAQAVLFLTR